MEQSRGSIWAARIIAAFLCLPLFAALAAGLCTSQTASLLEGGFYVERLDETGFYEFALAGLPAALLEDRRAIEAETGSDDPLEAPLTASGLSTERIVAGLNRAVPQPWLREAVERNAGGVVDYLTGKGDEFTIVVRTDERTDPLATELRALIDESELYSALYERALIPRMVDAIEEWAGGDLPLGVDVTAERAGSASRTIVPQEWMEAHVERILDEVTPYVKGASDAFTIHVPLSDRVEVASVEIKAILAEGSTYDTLYDEVVAPEVAAWVGGRVRGLPYGVDVTADEVTAVLRETAPPSWVREQAERVIDETVPYVAGRVDAFEFTVSIVENKRLAEAPMRRLIEEKTRAVVDALPACETLEQARAAAAAASGAVPACVPPGAGRDERVAGLVEDIGAEAVKTAMRAVPDRVEFTQVTFRDALAESGGAAAVERLDDVRAMLRDGWTYTHEDLRDDLGAPGDTAAFDRLQTVRSLLSGGWTYTEADLREDAAERTGPWAKTAIDDGRTALRFLSWLRWPAYLPALLLATFVGLVGGRDWWGRGTWAAVSLAVCAALAAMLAGVAYPLAAPGLLDAAQSRADVLSHPEASYFGTSRLVVEQSVEVVFSSAGAFASGVFRASLVTTIVAALAAAATVAASNREQLAALARRAWYRLRYN